MSCFYFCFFLLIFVFKVLGYLSLCSVADGQARMPVINGRTATPVIGRIIRGYTIGFQQSASADFTNAFAATDMNGS